MLESRIVGDHFFATEFVFRRGFAIRCRLVANKLSKMSCAILQRMYTLLLL
jgi:hypothetical protein